MLPFLVNAMQHLVKRGRQLQPANETMLIHSDESSVQGSLAGSYGHCINVRKVKVV